MNRTQKRARKRARLTNLIWLGLIIFLVATFIWGNIKVQLGISYLSETNDVEHAIAYFKITNAGNVSLNSYRFGTVEVQGQSGGQQVPCQTTQTELPPGQSDTATVILPHPMQKPWRFTMYYNRVGISPSLRGNRATSDWIN